MAQKSLFDLNALKKFRQKIHQNAEPSFLEEKTKKSILDYLKILGVPSSCIKQLAKTGLAVDISGQAKSDGSPPKTIAFRADMDALEMPEENPHISYRSTTKASHACGHDGHLACLLGAISLFLENIQQIPENKTARFLFQPAEELGLGASEMIKENCLESVSEIWGMHNIPFEPVGAIYVKSGPMMASVIDLKVTAIGKGGHSSLKAELANPVLPICEFLVEVERILQTEFAPWNEKEISLVFPQIESSSSKNVIPDISTLRGCLRSFDKEISDKLIDRLKQLCEEIGQKRKVKMSLEIEFENPIVSNDSKLVNFLKENFGERVKDENLPVKASEDFSHYTEKIPGCFYFLAIGAQNNFLHTSGYNFNDEVIETASEIWWKIIKARLMDNN